ncbi:MAG: protein-L-isoaspartate O-methyltransferase [Pseudomonadota bacterium]|nr:protein-L-isoaspartate O-methyltransferase [Pseudomonadota bacterium]
MNVEQARFNMVEQQIRTWEVLDPGLLDLLFRIKREDFVPEGSEDLAFADVELPIGHDQLMLQPKLEARLLQEALIKSEDKVLEIGTGTGYMTALLSYMARQVISVDIFSDFIDAATIRLAKLGIGNVLLRTGDASRGWAEKAPYDVIIMTGSEPVLPGGLIEMLNPGGRLIAILGDVPVMSVERIQNISPGNHQVTDLFETCVLPLINAVQPERFVF